MSVATLDLGWRSMAACRGMDLHLFFPAPYSSATTGLAVCDRCPVVVECLEHGLAHEEDGVWGGATAADRHRIRAARRRRR